MGKIRLELDRLRVDSFRTEPVAGGGTVVGHSYPNACFPPTGSMDPFLATCDDQTCAGDTCHQSCLGTCVVDGCGAGGSNPEQCQPTLVHTYCPGDSCVEMCFPPTG